MSLKSPLVQIPVEINRILAIVDISFYVKKTVVAGAIASSVVALDGFEGNGFVDEWSVYYSSTKSVCEHVTQSQAFSQAEIDSLGIPAGSAI